MGTRIPIPNPMALDMQGTQQMETPKWAKMLMGGGNALFNALTAPGKAYNGLYDRIVDPNTGENYYGGMAEDAGNLAGLVTLGAGAIPAEQGALRMGFGSLKDVEKFAAEKGVKLDVAERPDSISLSAIVVPKEARGKGIGSEVVKALTDYADATKKTIAATPSTDFGASSIKALERFYKRAGFSNNTGKAKDFRFRETMTREPKQK